MTTIEDVMRQKESQFDKKWKDVLVPKENIGQWMSVSTGIPMLDINIGIGGYPIGRVCEIYGLESSGKTTIALYGVIEAQRSGMKTLYVDMEQALDLFYARKIGVDIDSMVTAQPDYGEQALDLVYDAINSGYRFVIVDSVSSLIPKAQMERSVEDNFIGLQARMMSQAMPKLTPIIAKNNAIVIFINQIREKIGVLYGNPETTSGGNALKFYSSIRLEVRKGSEIKQGSNAVGIESKIRIKKNKLAPKGDETTVPLLYGNGLDILSNYIDVFILKNIIERTGAWYKYKGNNIANGYDNLVMLLKSNQQLFNEIKSLL